MTVSSTKLSSISERKGCDAAPSACGCEGDVRAQTDSSEGRGGLVSMKEFKDKKVQENRVKVQDRTKVKLVYKLTVFTASVITLSWFFEGTRQINDGLNVSSIGHLVVGTLGTVLMIGIYSYWIYIEEKAKGTLRKRIGLFEKIYSRLHEEPGSESSQITDIESQERGER